MGSASKQSSGSCDFEAHYGRRLESRGPWHLALDNARGKRQTFCTEAQAVLKPQPATSTDEDSDIPRAGKVSRLSRSSTF